MLVVLVMVVVVVVFVVVVVGLVIPSIKEEDKAGGLWGWRSMRKHFYIFFHSFASIWGWTRAFRGEKKAGFLGTESKERGRESFEVCSRTREGLTKFGEENQTQRNEQQWFERWRRHTKFTLTFYDHINRTNSQLVIFNLLKKKKKKKFMIFNILLCEVAVTVSVLIHSQWSFKSFFTSLSLCIDSQIVIFGVLNETFRIFFLMKRRSGFRNHRFGLPRTFLIKDSFLF